MAFGNSLVEVGIAIHLRDQFSNKTGQIAGSFRGLMNDLRTAAQMTQAAFGVELAGIGAVAGFGIDSYKEYAAVAKDVFLSTKMIGGSQAEYNDLLQQAKEINLEVPLTSKDISSAQRYMAMAGMGLEEITAMTKPVAQLASLFDMSAGGKGGVADILTNIMATFQLKAGDVNDTVDDLFTAVTSCNMSLEDLGNAIKMAGSEATVSGVDIRETAAAIGLLGDMGIQGTAAGTAIANTLRYLRLSLSGQKEKGYQALQALGLGPEDFYDANGELKSLHNTYQKFAEAVVKNKLTADEVGAAFYNIFGVRGERNMLLVMQQMVNGNDKMAQVLGKMASNQGIVNDVATEYLDTEKGQIDQLISNIDYFKQTVGEQASQLFTPILSVTNSILRFINDASKNPFVAWLMKAGLVLTFNAALVVVGRMGTTFITMFRAMRVSAGQIANEGRSFSSSMQAALTAMLLMNQASHGLAVGQRLPIGNIGGQPAYLTKGKSGALGLTYTTAAGTTGHVTNQTRMAGMMMYGTASGLPPKTPPPGGKGGLSAPIKSLGSKLVGPMARLGRGVLSAIPVVGTVASVGFLLYDGISALIGASQENTEALRKQQEEEELKRARDQYRGQAIAALNAAQINQLRVTGMLNETLDSLAMAIANGQDINLVINGQAVRKIASDTAIDVTQQAFGAYDSGASNVLKNAGY